MNLFALVLLALFVQEQPRGVIGSLRVTPLEEVAAMPEVFEGRELVIAGVLFEAEGLRMQLGEASVDGRQFIAVSISPSLCESSRLAMPICGWIWKEAVVVLRGRLAVVKAGERRSAGAGRIRFDVSEVLATGQAVSILP